MGAEILEGLKYVDGAEPYANDSASASCPIPSSAPWRAPGHGDIPGVAVVLGKANAAEDVAKIVKDYQSKGIMTFLVGDVIDAVRRRRREDGS